ncbi:MULTISPECIES: nucleotidyltransferase family protein [Paenibacillus]|uniref:hypothetical protein n=1 Tax=Paenibacillus TaxID=44249 RepID=UPI0022B8C1EE|nr:hypothetical protein [Paenibacillus caseinilyticus]MCZ8522935.1 hypothetical protein [Paenibacillus caseinilyticus]
MPHAADDPGLAKLPPRHLRALRTIAGALDGADIAWGLGGSALLYVRGLTARLPNDIDLLLDENEAPQAFERLAALGPAELQGLKEPYCSLHFRRFTLEGCGADLIAGFGIRHEEGVYRLPWSPSAASPRLPLHGTPDGIPLTPLEDWYVLYLLLPGRADKAQLIEDGWKDGVPLRSGLLREALDRPLPAAVCLRILAVLKKAGEPGA